VAEVVSVNRPPETVAFGAMYQTAGSSVSNVLVSVAALGLGTLPEADREPVPDMLPDLATLGVPDPVRLPVPDMLPVPV
jgi:hypothetical protein